jgi:transposase
MSRRQKDPLRPLSEAERISLSRLSRSPSAPAAQVARVERLERAPDDGRNAIVRLLARVVGVGVETAEMLAHEVLSCGLRDRRRWRATAGLTGAPAESGAKRRETGLAKVSNARVRCGMLQLAWRFLRF